MKKVTGFKKGYCIRIIDGFYEVIDGNRIVHFGQCRRNSTIQEIANKTILANQEDTDVRLHRVKGNVGQCGEKRYRARNQIDAGANVVGM